MPILYGSVFHIKLLVILAHGLGDGSRLIFYHNDQHWNYHDHHDHHNHHHCACCDNCYNVEDIVELGCYRTNDYLLLTIYLTPVKYTEWIERILNYLLARLLNNLLA